MVSKSKNFKNRSIKQAMIHKKIFNKVKIRN